MHLIEVDARDLYQQLFEGEITLSELKEHILLEVRKQLLTKQEKKLLAKTSVRRELLERCGNKAFLLPDELKFPIVSPVQKGCKPDCRLLYAAYLRANEWKKKHPVKYARIAKEAEKLFEKMKCENKLKIHIRK